MFYNCCICYSLRHPSWLLQLDLDSNFAQSPVTVLFNLQLLNALPGCCEMWNEQVPSITRVPFGNDRMWYNMWVSSPEMLLTKSRNFCPVFNSLIPTSSVLGRPHYGLFKLKHEIFKISHMRLHRMTHKLFSVQTCLIGGGDHLRKPPTL